MRRSGVRSPSAPPKIQGVRREPDPFFIVMSPYRPSPQPVKPKVQFDTTTKAILSPESRPATVLSSRRCAPIACRRRCRRSRWHHSWNCRACGGRNTWHRPLTSALLLTVRLSPRCSGGPNWSRPGRRRCLGAADLELHGVRQGATPAPAIGADRNDVGPLGQ